MPADKVYTCALSAIEIALWDIKGKALDLPVYKLLGGPVRDKVVCYPHTRGRSTEELVEHCMEQVREGWKFVRWGQPETGGEFGYRGTNGLLEPVKSIPRARHPQRVPGMRRQRREEAGLRELQPRHGPLRERPPVQPHREGRV